MFCKHCGKEIADDSLFCMYCGTRLDASLIKETDDAGSTETSKIKVEVYDGHKFEKDEKTKKKKSSLANEVIGLFKVILIGFGLWIVYMIGFEIYHLDDIKSHPDLPWGSSRYDEKIIVGDYVLNENEADRAFRDALSIEEDYISRYGLGRIKMGDGYVDLNVHLSRLNEDQIKEWKEKRIKEDRERFSKEINDHRIYSHEKNRNNHMKYSALIIFLSLILGRYLFKTISWVINNKT